MKQSMSVQELLEQQQAAEDEEMAEEEIGTYSNIHESFDCINGKEYIVIDVKKNSQ